MSGSKGDRGHAEAAGTVVRTWTCGLTARVRISAPSLTQCGTLSKLSVLCALVSPICHVAVVTVLTLGCSEDQMTSLRKMLRTGPDVVSTG